MAKRRVNKYPKAFRQMALERMRTCGNVSALTRELGVDRTVLYHWRNLMPAGDRPEEASPVRELWETELIHVKGSVEKVLRGVARHFV